MPQKPHIRLVFVQLLFALAIGQLALKIGDVIIGRGNVEANLWQDFTKYPYVYSHLFLCVFLISSSWVGWQASKSSDSPQLAGFVISSEYLVLLMDIFLVISYFIIVRGSEVSATRAQISGNRIIFDFPILPPDSFTERFWIMVIFSTYFVWDIFTKIFQTRYLKHNGFYTTKREYFPGFKRSLITLICLVISVLVFLFLNKSSVNGTVAIDVMLIAIIWAFRGWKQTIKKKYNLFEEQIPSYIKKQLMEGSTPPEYPIKVHESESQFLIKRFVARLLPILIFMVALIYYILE